MLISMQLLKGFDFFAEVAPTNSYGECTTPAASCHLPVICKFIKLIKTGGYKVCSVH